MPGTEIDLDFRLMDMLRQVFWISDFFANKILLWISTKSYVLITIMLVAKLHLSCKAIKLSIYLSIASVVTTTLHAGRFAGYS